MTDIEYLELALEEAKRSIKEWGFPAWAILVKNGEIIAKWISIGNILNDHTSHGEIAAIREASRILETSHLNGMTLYSSMQPCLMCFWAANWSGVKRIVFWCKQTPELVANWCYEGTNDIYEINKNNTRKIELVYIDGFQDKVTDLVEKWLEQFKS